MKTVYFCDSTGKISGCATSNTEEDEPYAEMGRADGESLAWEDGPPIGGNTQDTHYFVGDVLAERPSMPVSVSGARITGIPSGSVLKIGEQTFEVDDGEADITGYSGTVKITCWPYLDAEVIV